MKVIAVIQFLEKFISEVIGSAEFAQVNALLNHILQLRTKVEKQLVTNLNFKTTGENYSRQFATSISSALSNFSPSKAGARLASARGGIPENLPSEARKLVEDFLSTVNLFL